MSITFWPTAAGGVAYYVESSSADDVPRGARPDGRRRRRPADGVRMFGGDRAAGSADGVRMFGGDRAPPPAGSADGVRMFGADGADGVRMFGADGADGGRRPRIF